MSAVVKPTVSDGTAIRPFSINVPEPELEDLRRRILATRLPGHFAAWEQPKFLSEEIRAGFKSLRS